MASILAADIGATNCRFALFEAEPDDPQKPLLRLGGEKWLPSQEFPDFSDALAALRRPGEDGSPPLIADTTRTPDIAVLAPAGPIQDDACRLSNVNWLVRKEDVRQGMGIHRVALINDFAAQAYACLMPESNDTVRILDGHPLAGAPIAVMGAGTGLGCALLLMDGLPGMIPRQSESRKEILRRFSKARVLSCEGGHALFPFVGEEEFRLAALAAKREGTERLIGDHMVTGKGLAHIFAFYTGRDLPPREATEQAADLPEVIGCFARFYARAARNFVLSTLALGGLYLSGGMALRLPALTHPAFAEELYDSGPQRPLMEALPVWHVRKAHSGLWGAALYGLLRLVEENYG